MRSYDPSEPLVFIHVPKTAGVSVKAVFRRWFPLHEHYYSERDGTMPVRRDLALLPAPVVLYGHFNRLRGFGVEDYYPRVRQFVTILRDPFEMAISGYFYVRKTGADWRDQSRVPQSDLRTFLRTESPNFLNHFPRVVTLENYREIVEEYFVVIGVMERLAESMRDIAAKLGKPFEDAWLSHENSTPRDEAHPADLRDEYRQRHRLEFEVYEYVARRYASS